MLRASSLTTRRGANLMLKAVPLIVRSSTTLALRRYASGLSNFQSRAVLSKVLSQESSQGRLSFKGGNFFTPFNAEKRKKLTPATYEDFLPHSNNPSFLTVRSPFNHLQNIDRSIYLDLSADGKENPSNDDGKETEPSTKEKQDKEKEKDEEDSKDETEGQEPDTSVKSSRGKGRSKAASSGAGASSSSSAGSGSDAFGSGHDGVKGGKDKEPNISEVYPRVIGLPISQRPLIPGFYKALVITDINVIKAIKDALNHKNPYIGCFLFKDPEMTGDVITSKDQVYQTGVLAQITSNLYAKDNKTGIESLTAVLYAHKRIRLDSLYPPKSDTATHVAENGEKHTKQVIEGITGEKEGDEPRKPSHKASVRKIQDEKLEPTEVLEKAEGAQLLSHQDALPDEPAQDEYLKKYPISLVGVSDVLDQKYDKNDPLINSLTASTLETLKKMATMNKQFNDELATFSASLHSDIYSCPSNLADFAAAVTAGKSNDVQEILETTDVKKRLKLSLVLLKKELANKEMQMKLDKELDDRIMKRQRTYRLAEQLKLIKEQIGTSDGRDALIKKYDNRVKKLNMPPEVKKVYAEEIDKLKTLEPMMSEYAVSKNYLDWLTQLPWGIESKDCFSVERAKNILNEDHYGLQDVKNRILEFVAVGKLANKVKGKILCFCGPPGVGKTSIGRSIAKSLNRKFYRISFGGLNDVSEIKGHRRTYVGASPGRIVQALRRSQTDNPLIMIDEIDKISTQGANNGNPAATLLELLDPEQNNKFLDNFMDVPIDLSKVLFVCTANNWETILPPILDRMEMIHIPGYTDNEKLQIAEKYLNKKIKKETGLENANINVTKPALEALVKYYCRESGVRSLKKALEKIYRKAALQLVEEIGDPAGSEAELAVSASESDKSKETNVEKENERKEEVAADLQTTSPEGKPAEKTLSANGEKPNENVSKGKEKTPEITKLIIPDDFKLDITPKNLSKYVGPPVFTSDRMYMTPPPGIVMGLAYSSMSGAAMYFETALVRSLKIAAAGKLEMTGHLGDVLKESADLAYSVAKNILSQRFPDNRFFERAYIHMNCPEGGISKDGPSAGITMTTAFLSLALNHPIPGDVAMTGEISLGGKVLPIGGLREKTLAARRCGIKTMIIPKSDLPEWDEVPEQLKEGIDVHFVDWYSEVFDLLFKDVTPEKGNNVWKEEFSKRESPLGIPGDMMQTQERPRI